MEDAPDDLVTERSVIDVDVDRIPSTGLTLEEYRRLGGVPLSRQKLITYDTQRESKKHRE